MEGEGSSPPTPSTPGAFCLFFTSPHPFKSEVKKNLNIKINMQWP